MTETDFFSFLVLMNKKKEEEEEYDRGTQGKQAEGHVNLVTGSRHPSEGGKTTPRHEEQQIRRAEH